MAAKENPVQQNDPVETFFENWMRVAPSLNLSEPADNDSALKLLKTFADIPDLEKASRDPDAIELQAAAKTAVTDKPEQAVLAFAEAMSEIAQKKQPRQGDTSPKAQWLRIARAFERVSNIPSALVHAVSLLKGLHDIHRGECQMVEVLSAKEADNQYLFKTEDPHAAATPGRFLWTPIPWLTALAKDELRRAYLCFGESGRFMALQQDLIKAVLGRECLSYHRYKRSTHVKTRYYLVNPFLKGEDARRLPHNGSPI